MLIGHYSAALAAKAAKPELPLWQLFLAAQLVDIGWVILCWQGFEIFNLDFNLLSNPLVLIHQPYTHSLLAAGIWAMGLAAIAVWLFRYSKAAAFILAAVVASHWPLDFLVHRPDLAIWPGVNVGLALWDVNTLPMLLEMALVASAGLLLWRASPVAKPWYVGLTLVLVALVATNYLIPPPQHKSAILLTALAVYLCAPLAVWWLERRIHTTASVQAS